MLLIGFGHKARQGKNTAALAFLEACPIDSHARLYAFADALRLEVRKACYQMGSQDALIESFKEAGLMPDWVHAEQPKPRTLMQWWGTEYRRKQDPLYWVKRLRKTFDDAGPEIALVTDVRFPDEAAAIKSWGGYLVRVIRTTEPDVIVPKHPSEQALDGYAGWDYELTAASVPELKEKARALYQEMRTREKI